MFYLSLFFLNYRYNLPPSFLRRVRVDLLLLQPAVKPVEECALPENTILWFEHPVVLVREEQQFCRDSLHAGCIEGTHSLIGIDAVVLLAVDTKDWGIPVVNSFMWAVSISLACSIGLVLLPLSIIILPVREPSLLSIGVH